MKKKLTKSNDKVIGGVFGGIAEYFGWDKSWVRLIGALLIVFPGHIITGTIIYVIAMLAMPEKPNNMHKKDDDVFEGEFRTKD